MTTEELLTQIKAKLGDKIVQWTEQSARRVYIEVQPQDIPETSHYLFRDLAARLAIATGTDAPDAIEVLYHWAFDDHALVFSVLTKLNRENPQIESIAGICKGAEWIEREMWELLGINFLNHPDLRHLLLADDWPAGKYPLRRDYIKEEPVPK